MTYAEARRFFDSLLNYEAEPLNSSLPRRFNLRRVEALLGLLGSPQRGLPVLHVGGTKGKGSVCAFLSSALRSAGYRVCVYAQPHLVSVRERFQLDGRCISRSDFASLAAEVRPAAEAMRGSESDLGRVTFFEAYTALFFLYARRSEADIAVAEVGMGGRLDATNVCEPVAAAVAPIGFDHMEALGWSLAEIAAEKAGIVKRGVPIVSAAQERSAEAVLRSAAESCGSRFVSVAEDVCVERFGALGGREECSLKRSDSSLEGLRLRLLGRHQAENAALAYSVLAVLRELGWSAPDEAARAGFEAAWVPGRFQLTRGMDGRELILDAAHTPESGAALGRLLGERYDPQDLSLIVGMSRGKDAVGFAEALVPRCSEAVLTESPVANRARPASELEEVWSARHPRASVQERLLDAYRSCSRPSVCVTGSLYLVGEALRELAPAGYREYCEELGL